MRMRRQTNETPVLPARKNKTKCSVSIPETGPN
jgi:hypothetical protein